MMMTDTQKELTKYRKDIDKIDYKIHALLNERANLALSIGKIKAVQQKEPMDYYRPQREAEILAGIIESNTGPLSSETVCHIFKKIITACRELQISQYTPHANK